ncbi:hypothetical protein NDN08_007823 [Rhodosorus marinus]|uniref:polynucleotide adenylyltransferase n=1 Tax=Rhodosorus marinus TaxID=101924 RepID=A0AAV8V2U6_9RHOD|nr:hypothetical protein NDN08_007823 [Rhodosorus marinus]
MRAAAGRLLMYLSDDDSSEDKVHPEEEPGAPEAWKEIKLEPLDGVASETPVRRKSDQVFSLFNGDKRGNKRQMKASSDDFLKFSSSDDEEKADNVTAKLEEGEQVDEASAGVLPPWVRSEELLFALKHSTNKMVTLHYEILDFCRFVTPTDAEHQKRLRLLDRVEEVVKIIWPSAKVVVFGSFATGLYLPSSDIDVCVFESPGKGSTEDLNTLADELRKKPGFLRRIQVIDKARVPLVKLVDRETNVQCDISFNQESGPNNVAFIRKHIEDFPSLKPLLMVIKCFLQQRNLGEVFRGGLGSYALFLLTLSHLQMHQFNFPRPANALGDMLMDFFELYGEVFNNCYTGVAVLEGGSYYKKLDKYGLDTYQPMLFSVEDPQGDHSEIARNSFAALTIRKALNNARKLLQAWRPDQESEEHPTPLSSILHVDDLIWSRRHFVSQENQPDEAENSKKARASANTDSDEDGELSDEKYEPLPVYAYKPTAFPSELPKQQLQPVTVPPECSPQQPEIQASAMQMMQALALQGQLPPAHNSAQTPGGIQSLLLALAGQSTSQPRLEPGASQALDPFSAQEYNPSNRVIPGVPVNQPMPPIPVPQGIPLPPPLVGNQSNMRQSSPIPPTDLAALAALGLPPPPPQALGALDLYSYLQQLAANMTNRNGQR